MVKGRKSETSRGLAYLDCARCPKGLQRDRGCRRFGLAHRSLSPWRVDFTQRAGDDELDWCPASALDLPMAESLSAALYRAIEEDRHGGPLEYFGTPTGHLPHFYVWFREEVVAARDRFLDELSDAYREAS